MEVELPHANIIVQRNKIILRNPRIRNDKTMWN